MRIFTENPELGLICVWSAGPRAALAVIAAHAVWQVTSWCWDSQGGERLGQAQSLGTRPPGMETAAHAQEEGGPWPVAEGIQGTRSVS